jgi:hypothetical protein
MDAFLYHNLGPKMGAEDWHPQYPEHPCYFWGRLFMHAIGLGQFERTRHREALPPQVQDLWPLYWHIRTCNPWFTMEYGTGLSTAVMALALYHNKMILRTKRREGVKPTKCFIYAMDHSEKWIKRCVLGFPPELLGHVKWQPSRVEEVYHGGDHMLQFNLAPNMPPSFVYIDGPDLGVMYTQAPADHECFGIVDPIYYEHKLKPGTQIVIDGRVGNVKFLKENFQRTWQWQDHWAFEQTVATLKE